MIDAPGPFVGLEPELEPDARDWKPQPQDDMTVVAVVRRAET